MKLAKLRRFVATLLAVLTFVSAVAVSTPAESASAAVSGEYKVRVGIYISTSYMDSRRFSTRLTSGTGFDFGYSTGKEMTTLFSHAGSSIIILPQTNANVNLSAGNCSANPNGSVGAYSATVSSHSSASEAFARAKAIQGGFVAVTKTGYEVRAYSANTAEKVASSSGGLKVNSPVSGGLTVLDGKTGKILFTYEDSKRFAVKGKNDVFVAVPTGESRNHKYAGFFEFWNADNLLWMVNCLDIETYTKCVMSIEIGTTFSVETRKAFSLLVRTFAYAGKHGSLCDVCPTTCCQMYLGDFRMSDTNNEVVDSTRGMYLAYEGRPISALYHISSGGATCSSLAAWGSRQVPYLMTVFQEETDDGLKWNESYTKSEFYEFMKSRKVFSGLEDSNISVNIVNTDPHGSDYITLLEVSDGKGNTVEVKSAERVRAAFGYKSGNFKVEYSTSQKVLASDGSVGEKEITGVLTADGYEQFDGFADSFESENGASVAPDRITILGAGHGHGVGFSVWGAEQLARDGYSYQYIANCFYNGVTIRNIYS